MIDYHSEFYKLVVVTGDQDYYDMDANQFNELIRQARLAGQEGAVQLQDEMR